MVLRRHENRHAAVLPQLMLAVSFLQWAASIRNRIAAVFIAVLMIGSGSIAQAQAIADGQALRIVAPSAAGGAVDMLARLVAQHMGDALGQSVVVENKPGAGGIIASDYVARSRPDGSVLLIGSVQTHGINPSLHASLPYDAVNDFVPIGLLASSENVLTVNPQSPFHTLDDLVQAARARPGMLTLGTGGNGTSGHLSGAKLEMMAGVEFVHVPYKGGALALNDLMGGQIDMVFDSFVTALPMIQAGKLRALAVPSQSRTTALPDVPTFIESGYEGFESNGWCILFAPAGTPETVITKLNEAMNKALQDPVVRKRLAEVEFPAKGGSPHEAAEYMHREISKWGELVKASGAKAN